MPRKRTVFLGGFVGGALSMLLAPRLGGVRRGPLARVKPLAVLDRRALSQFAGTPCAAEHLRQPAQSKEGPGRPGATAPRGDVADASSA
jgi:hypothetical protein